MSLDWSIADVANKDTLCWQGEGKDRHMNPVTEVLIYSTMFIGIPWITAKTVKEFQFRMDVHQKMFGALLSSPTGPVEVTAEDVAAHIGLGTNASTINKAKWLKTIQRRQAEELRRKSK